MPRLIFTKGPIHEFFPTNETDDKGRPYWTETCGSHDYFQWIDENGEVCDPPYPPSICR